MVYFFNLKLVYKGALLLAIKCRHTFTPAESDDLFSLLFFALLMKKQYMHMGLTILKKVERSDLDFQYFHRK